MDPHEHQHGSEEGVDLPIPTANPIITAFGITLLAAGIVTSLIVSLVGFIIGLIGAVGWFRDVFPTPKHVLYPLADADRRPKPVRVSPRRITHLQYGQTGHRVRVPVEVHRYSAGIIGGLAGGAAMAILAMAYGLVVQHSIWYGGYTKSRYALDPGGLALHGDAAYASGEIRMAIRRNHHSAHVDGVALSHAETREPGARRAC